MDPDLFEWVEARVGGGKKFATVSHAVDRGFLLLKLEEEGKLQILEKTT